MKKLIFLPVVVLVVMLSGFPVAAEKSKPAVLVPTVFTGTFLNREELRQLADESLVQTLRDRGVEAKIVKSARACMEAPCFAELGAERVVSAQLMNTGRFGPNMTYRVVVRLWVRGEPLRVRERECPSCNDLRGVELLKLLLVAALDNEPEPVKSPPDLAPPDPKPEDMKKPEDLKPEVVAPPAVPTRSRIYFGVAVGGGAGLLASAIALGVKHKQDGDLLCNAGRPSGYPCPQRRDTSNGVVGSAVALSLFAVVTAVGIGLGVKAKRRERKPIIVPSADARSVSITLSGDL